MKLLARISVIIFVAIVSGFLWKIFSSSPLPIQQIYSFSEGYYDRHHTLLRLSLSHDDQYRLWVPLSDIPPRVQEALLLAEDRYFYWHPGVNPIALMKAFWKTDVIQSRRIGASTLSMQLVRLMYKLNTKTVSGKLRQILFSMQLELHWRKRDILEAYLNLAPYGNNIQGIGAASLLYFGKEVKNLSLPQILVLSTLPQNPGNPNREEILVKRQALFAAWMKLHPEDQPQTPWIKLAIHSHLLIRPFLAPHFVNQLQAASIMQQGGIAIATLDYPLQILMEHIIKRYVTSVHALGVNNASALLVDSRDMSVLSMIGSVSYFDQTIAGKVNGTHAKRSPGSTLKPFIYALAMDQGLIHPDTMLKDLPKSFGHYNPENFDHEFIGPIKVKDALLLSRNIPAIALANALKQPNLYQLLEAAHVAHLKSADHYGLALVLGGGEVTMQELATLYAMLVNDGQWRPLRMLRDEPLATGTKLLSPEASYLTLWMLSQHQPASQFDSSDANLFPINQIAWKTGTSSGFRDAWSVGVMGPYVLVVWLGDFHGVGNHALVGKSMAVPLMLQLFDAMRRTTTVIPSMVAKMNLHHLHITEVEVCKASGMLPTKFCKDREKTWFIPGKSPIKTDTIFREVAIDKKTGLRTCHFDQNVTFKIYEFWPSDFLQLFQQAGVMREVPPDWLPGCIPSVAKGIAPNIVSPETHLSYVACSRYTQAFSIPLTAISDADVKHLYWFAGEQSLGQVARDHVLAWSPTPGHYALRVLDDVGRSDTREVLVTACPTL